MEYDGYLQLRHFANLDMLRGIAILAVVFYHSGHVSTPWLAIAQANCRHGVSLFFALSGFLICTLMLREERRNGRVCLSAFYARRTLRLFPLYYAVLALYSFLVFGLGLFSPENRAIFTARLPYHALYLSNFFPVDGPLFFAWSLAVEEQFYLVFGQLFRWARRSWLIAGIVLLLLAKPALYLAGILDLDHLGLQVFCSYSEPLLMGVLCGFALDSRRCFGVMRLAGSPRVLAALSGGLIVLLSSVALRDKSGLPSQVTYVLMALIVSGCALRPALRVPGYALLSHIGVVCYGIYLMHTLVITVVQKTVTEVPYFTFLLSAAGVVVLASVVYRYFESPILQFKSRFSSGSFSRKATRMSGLPPVQKPGALL